jgi:alpha-mannosidase
MYYSGRLERRYDLRFPVAIAMENQTLPLGLSSLWAGSGALYSWKGVCGCASKIPNKTLSHRDHEIYWYTGLDGQRVLMKWHSLGPHGMGTYLEASDTEFAITYLDSDADFLSRYTDARTGKPYSVRAAFGFGGDCLARKTGVPADPGIPKEPGLQQGVPGFPYTEHFHITAEKRTTKTRQIVVSNTEDFFEDFAAEYGKDLPTESVTYGNEWDLYSASMAETSSRVRRSVEKLRAAELMSTLVSLQRPDFLAGRVKARDQAFTDLGLYWEHDWTADGPVSRAHRAVWEEMLASEIEYYVNPLHADAGARLGYLIQKPAAADRRFFALNPLGETRTDFADFAYTGSANIHVRDLTTGSDVPHQFVTLDGVRSLRILASDAPRRATRPIRF